MSTAETIRNTWSTYVFSNASITSITTKVLDYELVLDAQREALRIRLGTVINFFSYVVSRSYEPVMVAGASNLVLMKYRVDVKYHLEQQQTHIHQNYRVVDRMGTLQSVVTSQLGKTWQGTVDFGGPLGDVDVFVQEIDNRPCAVARQIFTATKIGTLS